MRLAQRHRPRVLIVDDAPENLQILRTAIEPLGCRIRVATSGAAALKAVSADLPDLVLLDILMPGMDGYEVCRRLQADEATQAIPIIFITACDDKLSILRGFQAGGADFISKPFEREEVVARAQLHLDNRLLARELARRNRELEARNAELEQEVQRRRRAEATSATATERLDQLSQREARQWAIEDFLSASPTMKRLLAETRALQEAPSASVLILGESGTGKELIARALHSGSSRAAAAFVPVNCSAIPRELAESMLFGHCRGAFTGAASDRKGCFELAHGGTLFLDEVGEMPLELQAKLLRVLESGHVTRLGDDREHVVDVRVVAATNVDLPQVIGRGAFRQDLYFRLAHCTVQIPPLRQRQEDISLLAQHFVRVLAAEMGRAAHGRPIPDLSVEALACLQGYAFPGNVRELKNMMEFALIRCGEGPIQPEHLHFLSLPVPPGGAITATPSKSPPPDAPRPTPEALLLAFVAREHSITNAQCRDLLGVDRHRASYLLDKLCARGKLVRQGSHRWTRYHLPGPSPGPGAPPSS